MYSTAYNLWTFTWFVHFELPFRLQGTDKIHTEEFSKFHSNIYSILFAYERSNTGTSGESNDFLIKGGRLIRKIYTPESSINVIFLNILYCSDPPVDRSDLLPAVSASYRNILKQVFVCLFTFSTKCILLNCICVYFVKGDSDQTL